MRWTGVLGGMAVLAMLGSEALVAQGPGGGMRGGMMAAPQLEELKTALTLDAEQEAKVKALLEKFEADTKGARETVQKNMQAMRDGTATDATRGENMAAMMVIREHNDQLNKQIRELLQPEQYAAFDAWLAARQARRPGGRPPQ